LTKARFQGYSNSHELGRLGYHLHFLQILELPEIYFYFFVVSDEEIRVETWSKALKNK
jgi:hypothetical protein